MKKLDDWLASESSDDDAPPFEDSKRPSARAAVSIPTATKAMSSMPSIPSDSSIAAGRDSTQEKMRERMKKYLGEAAVVKSQELAAASVASPNSFLPPFNATHTAVSSSHSDSPHSTSERANGARRSLPTTATSSSPQPTHVPCYEAVEVMLVDRGTQTVSTVAVQTEPLPVPEWLPGGVGFRQGTGVGTIDGGIPLHGNAPGLDYLSLAGRPVYGIDGRPYRQLTEELEVNYAAGAKRLRSQLSLLQNNIDMLISRYNLPPPPFF